jgi:hypothetical protein
MPTSFSEPYITAYGATPDAQANVVMGLMIRYVNLKTTIA